MLIVKMGNTKWHHFKIGRLWARTSVPEHALRYLIQQRSQRDHRSKKNKNKNKQTRKNSMKIFAQEKFQKQQNRLKRGTLTS